MSYAHFGIEAPRDRRYVGQGFHRRIGEICREENISERYVVSGAGVFIATPESVLKHTSH